ncbi:MFS transporter [Bermanella marisrubri]|uniref:Permease of the major facilitator superfamily protein n=1 Tax=Bermanella marisrubri TaxID=207949 RepID=Q1N3D0_9GAMM|nr:MFS transporter [Bermanella marisrubri]EAT12661.1 Permease of the major facilitator superfamily protein [Oceanobacter sp. RED65] [Bermanella marisrubri]QIZ85214.1 MFS transporter [Bermanella marisrubri]
MSLDLDKLYQYAANEEDARVCKDIDESACKEVPGNFFKILLTQTLTKLADALASSKVVLPWLMAGAGVPALYTGLVVPIRESGSLLPQLFIGGVIRSYPVRKWSFVLGSVLQGVCVLLMMWTLLTWQGTQAGITTIALLIVFSLSRGLCSVASKDVLGKTIPKSRRGLLTGYAGSSSGLVTLLISVGLFVYVDPDAGVYPYLLAIAAGAWFLGAWSYASVNEFAGETDGGGNAFKNAIESLSILKTDPEFSRFVTVRAFLLSTGLAAPFIVLAAQSSDLAQSWMNLGLFVGVSGLASLLSGRFWGRFADLASHKLLMITAGLSTVICALVVATMWLSTPYDFYLYLILFFALSVTLQGIRIARKTYVVDLAGGNKRTEYVSVSNTAIGFLLLISGVITSVIALYSQIAVMVFFSLSGLAACLIGRKLPSVAD